MNRLYLALLLTIATTSVVINAEPVARSVPGMPEPDNSNQDIVLPIDTISELDYLSLGTIGANDRLLARINYSVENAVFVTHDQEITIRGFEYTNITAVRVIRVAQSSVAYPSITAGGLGYNDVTIRFLGTRERGFDYIIQVYSSIGC